MEDDLKLCLICGVNVNKKARHDRYNLPPEMIKKKPVRYEESESDSDDSTRNSKSKKKTPKSTKAPIVSAPASSRQTRNRNPKTFAASLCKVMELPDAPDHPFLQIFSNADYCPDCMAKVKDAHSNQTEMEKLQTKLHEARVDFEIDLSKHLQKIPCVKALTRNADYERYKEDITAILDFHSTDEEKIKKKNKLVPDEEDDGNGRRSKRQKRVDSPTRLQQKMQEVKRLKGEVLQNAKLEENNSENEAEAMSNNCVIESHFEKGVGELETNGASEVKVETELSPVAVQVEPPKPKVKKDPNLKCQHCPIPRYFNLLENLEEHVERCHKDRKIHACDLCERKFASLKALHGHKASVHDVTEGFGWNCGFCDQNFGQKRYLEDHLDQHPQAKPLNCQFCGGSFPRKESLQKAFQIYKGEPVDPCTKCGRNLNLKDYLDHNRKVKEQ